MQIYPFKTLIGVMKPNELKLDKSSQASMDKFNNMIDGDDYWLELKVDGCHYINTNGNFFSTRLSKKGEVICISQSVPHLTKIFADLNLPNLFLDGEINYEHINPLSTSQDVISVTGAGYENALIHQEKYGYVQYTIFDILRLPNGGWVTNMTYIKRREILEFFYSNFIAGTEAEKYISISEVVKTNKRITVENWIAKGIEGGVFKRLESTYICGRSPMWDMMKYKKKADPVDCFIIGYNKASIQYTGKADLNSWPYWDIVKGENIPVTKNHKEGLIGSIQLGQYKDGEIIKVGNASGMTDIIRREITDNSDLYINRVVKIAYMEKTNAGMFRSPSILEIHNDKNAEECIYDDE